MEGSTISTTANYGLYITDNDAERFIVWRNKMNGLQDSNMHKIDAALSLLEQNANFGVKYNAVQELTSEQKTQVRQNIGIGEEISNDDIDVILES